MTEEKLKEKTLQQDVDDYAEATELSNGRVLHMTPQERYEFVKNRKYYATKEELQQAKGEE